MLDGLKIDNIPNAINPTANLLIIIEHAQLLLAVQFLYVDELAHALEGQLAVILADYADVVLH